MKRMQFFRRLKYMICGLLVVFIIQACGHRTPIIGGESPFVVIKIEQYNDTHSEYISYINHFVYVTHMITLPTGMYNVGDTIKVGFIK